MKQIMVDPKEGTIILEDVPAPLCDENKVLIHVKYSLISTGTELAAFRQTDEHDRSILKKALTDKNFRERAFNYVKTTGIKNSIHTLLADNDKQTFQPTGYSGAGVVLEVGKNVVGLSIGDKVAYAGVSHAEIVCAPKNFVIKLPDDLKLEEAAFTPLGGIAIQGVRRAKVEFGETILVIGLGLVGQLVNQLLQVAGCHVIGSDLSEKRIALAQEFGLEKGIIANKDDFEKEVLRFTDQVGVDAVIICAQSRSDVIINQAMSVCREHGRVVVVGEVGLNIQRKPFFLNELELKISRAYGHGCNYRDYVQNGIDYPIGLVRWTANRNMKEFVKLLSLGKINVGRLISKQFDVMEVQSAFSTLLVMMRM